MQPDEEYDREREEDRDHYRQLDRAQIDQGIEFLQQLERIILKGDGFAADQQEAEAAEEQLRGERDDHRKQFLELRNQYAVDQPADDAHQQARRDGDRKCSRQRHAAVGQRAVEHRQHHHRKRGDRAHGNIHIAQRQNQHHAQRHKRIQHVRAQGTHDVREIEYILFGKARRQIRRILHIEYDAHQRQQAQQEKFPAFEEGDHFLFHQMFLLARSCLLAMRCKITFSRIASSSRMPLMNSVIMELPMPSMGMALSISAIITAPITTPVILP